MGKKTIIFNQLIEGIDRKNFNNLAETHEANRYVKSFDAWSHLLTLLYAQLSNQESLRTIEMNFGHVIRKEKLNNVARPKRVTLSEANKRRPVNFFQDICTNLISKVQKIKKHKNEAKEILHLMDSTPIQLTGRGLGWAAKTQRITGLKAHFIYDTSSESPTYFSITSAKVNDIIEGQNIKLEPNQTLVFDRAYYDFAWWDKITKIGSTFVTRPKSTLAYKKVKERKAIGNNIQSDETIALTSEKGRKYKGPLRLIKANIEVRGIKKCISIITNNLMLSAKKVVAIYKKRWDIELFFKWIKQNLKIKKYFSQNENAIKIQIITAIIAYLLVKIMQIRSQSDISMRRLITFLKNHLSCKIKYKYGKKSVKISLPRLAVSNQVGLI